MLRFLWWTHTFTALITHKHTHLYLIPSLSRSIRPLISRVSRINCEASVLFFSLSHSHSLVPLSSPLSPTRLTVTIWFAVSSDLLQLPSLPISSFAFWVPFCHITWHHRSAFQQCFNYPVFIKHPGVETDLIFCSASYIFCLFLTVPTFQLAAPH